MKNLDSKAGGPGTVLSEDSIHVNGFQQILDMLKIADPEFRESLLRRLAARDGSLARELRRDLIQSGF